VQQVSSAASNPSLVNTPHLLVQPFLVDQIGRLPMEQRKTNAVPDNDIDLRAEIYIAWSISPTSQWRHNR